MSVSRFLKHTNGGGVQLSYNYLCTTAVTLHFSREQARLTLSTSSASMSRTLPIPNIVTLPRMIVLTDLTITVTHLV